MSGDRRWTWRLSEDARKLLAFWTCVLGAVYGLASPPVAIWLLVDPRDTVAQFMQLPAQSALAWFAAAIIAIGIVVFFAISGKAVLKRFLKGFLVGICLLILGIGLLIGICFMTWAGPGR
jgi:hypothetical protein